MPIYEYECKSCGERSEVMQRINDPPLETCEECGGALRKLISAPAFQFKGSGWYVTDYARKEGGDKKESKESKSASNNGGEKKKSSDSSSAASSNSSDSGSSAKSSSSKTKAERSTEA